MTNIAIENGPVEIVDLPIDSMVIFHSELLVYQRVSYLSATVAGEPQICCALRATRDAFSGEK